MRKPSPAGDIAWFIVWLIAFSAPVSAFIVHLGTQPPMMSRMLMWCPGAAALATCVTRKRDVRSLGWTWPRLRYIGWGYVIPLLYAIPVYALAWMLIPDAFQWSAYAGKLAHDFQVADHANAFAAFFGIPTTMIFIVISGMAWALGEEIGWRGFLVPRLYDASVSRARVSRAVRCGPYGITRAFSVPTTTRGRRRPTRSRASPSWRSACRSS